MIFCWPVWVTSELENKICEMGHHPLQFCWLLRSIFNYTLKAFVFPTVHLNNITEMLPGNWAWSGHEFKITAFTLKPNQPKTRGYWLGLQGMGSWSLSHMLKNTGENTK